MSAVLRLLAMVALACFASGLSTAAVTAQTKPVRVFAAASLTDALKAVANVYEAKTGRPVTLVFAASSALARQIEASAGADIFISADTQWMDDLANKGLIARGSRRNLLGNRLVLIAPSDSKISLKIGAHFHLLGALRGGRLAVADPDSVPAGKYAREALTSLGVWSSVAHRLAPAENVRMALAYVARGEAPLGIVYITDALSESKVRIVGAFAEKTHEPILYPAALIHGANPGAAAFLGFLSSADASALFRKAGFTVLP